MVKIIKSGFYTTIQDLGRMGYQKFGVPVSGAMDLYSSQLANALLGNDKKEALLEVAMTGLELQFNQDTFICITGAYSNPKLNQVKIQQNHVIHVKAGNILSFGKIELGFRAYLAVSGGFKTEMVMNSQSMYNNITKEFKIECGDEIQIETNPINLEQTYAAVKVNKNHFSSNEIKVFKGPEFSRLSKKQQQMLFQQDFTISNENSRMAYQLSQLVENNLKPIITSLVLPGTVQLTPSGKLIILMRDCQTTGGYPRVLQLKESSINVLAQKFTGNHIRFILID
jgi:biotin-dependent carboxylase-like uncharacterized protein